VEVRDILGGEERRGGLVEMRKTLSVLLGSWEVGWDGGEGWSRVKSGEEHEVRRSY
jgi:hypothetical protein